MHADEDGRLATHARQWMCAEFVPAMRDDVRVLLLVPNLIGYARLLCIVMAFTWFAEDTWLLFGLYVLQAALDGWIRASAGSARGLIIGRGRWNSRAAARPDVRVRRIRRPVAAQRLLMPRQLDVAVDNTGRTLMWEATGLVWDARHMHR